MSNNTNAASTQEEAIIAEICEYIKENAVKEMFHEYLKRLVLEQPNDPVQFLISSIESKPFEAHAFGFSPATTHTHDT